MCYDIAFEIKMRQLSDYFPDLVYDDQELINFEPFDHVQGVSVYWPHPIIYINRDDLKPHCKLMEWGIVEFYRKEIPDWKKRNGMLNIRSERILADQTSYWYNVRNRRCLIPVSGIYEHRAIPGWKKKVPYWIKPKEQDIFFLPGLYSKADIVDKETGEVKELWTFGMITRSANTLMQQIHNDGENKFRMPLFLPLTLSKKWLDEDLQPEEYEGILNFEQPSENLDFHPVWTIRTAKERPDGQTKDAFFEWPKLPEIVY